MTASTNDPVPTDRDANDPAELDRYLAAYQPDAVTPEDWQTLAPAAIALVKQAGADRYLRVKNDISVVSQVAARLIQRGRPLTLDEVLADGTLLDFDLARQRAGAAEKTREKDRGILRRLQAAHHGVPWRRPRRAAGERVTDLPPPTLAAELAKLVGAARRDADANAAALLATVDLARRNRRGGCGAHVTADVETWRRARAYAARHGMRLTARTLTAAVTHEVLLAAEPLAVLAATARLTRRDLDLGLTHAATLPASQSPAHRAALRGTAVGPLPVSIARPAGPGTVPAETPGPAGCPDEGNPA